MARLTIGGSTRLEGVLDALEEQARLPTPSPVSGAASARLSPSTGPHSYHADRIGTIQFIRYASLLAAGSKVISAQRVAARCLSRLAA